MGEFDGWDAAYENGETPWDIGRPQPAIRRLVETDAVTGRVLDAGCGRGEHARLVADRGHPVVGVDGSIRAIEQARAATPDDCDVRYRVADGLDLPPALRGFNTVLDCGLFHVFADRDRRRAYAESLAGVVAGGGRVHVLTFAAGAPEDWGPTPVERGEFAAAFDDGWTVEAVREASFESQAGTVRAHLATVARR